MTKAKQIAWALVTGTAAVTAVGYFLPEFGFAVASAALGGSSLVASLFATMKDARHSGQVKKRKELRWEETA